MQAIVLEVAIASLLVFASTRLTAEQRAG